MEENPKPQGARPYDLEERTFLFAKETRWRRKLESVSKKDFLLRIKTCRKEAKESAYWLRLLDCGSTAILEKERVRLTTEVRELMNIFGAILRKSE